VPLQSTYDGIGLKKMNVIVRPGENGAIEAATLEFNLENLHRARSSFLFRFSGSRGEKADIDQPSIAGGL
jgi:hypothetical protein